MPSHAKVSNIRTDGRNLRATWLTTIVVVMFTALFVMPAMAQTESEGEASEGQDRESMDLDSTATQWSFQFAYQGIPDYHDDVLDNGETRPAGNTDYFS